MPLVPVQRKRHTERQTYRKLLNTKVRKRKCEPSFLWDSNLFVIAVCFRMSLGTREPGKQLQRHNLASQLAG